MRFSVALSVRLVWLAVLAMGCEAGHESADDSDRCGGLTERHALVSSDAWKPVDAGEDPLVAHRPDVVSCPPDATPIEEGVLEINTDRCNYFAAAQPLRVDLKPCDVGRIVIYHDTLFSPTPAEGHLALHIDGELVWERTVPIPGPSALWTAEWSVSREVPAGTPIALHLHNHGLNTWRLVELSAGPARPVDE